MDEGVVLERLLRRYSPSGREGAAVAEFVQLAQELGYSATIDAAGSGLARRGSGPPSVMFLGHVDTVDGEVPVRREGDRLFGRGACDAKGPLAAALLAGREFSGPGEWVVVAAVGEETDSRGARYLASQPKPEFLIGGEPSRWDGVTVGYKGDLRLHVTFSGQRTHTSSPHPSTVEVAMDWAAKLRGPRDPAAGPSVFRSPTSKVTAVRTRLEGGTESVEVEIDLRIPPGRRTAEWLERAREGPPGIDVRVDVQIEPWEADRGDPVVRAFLQAIRAEGGEPTVWRKGGTSDVNLVLSAWKVPCAVYGPGDSRLDHTDAEFVELEDLRRAARVLRRVLEGLTSGAEDPAVDAP